MKVIVSHVYHLCGIGDMPTPVGGLQNKKTLVWQAESATILDFSIFFRHAILFQFLPQSHTTVCHSNRVDIVSDNNNCGPLFRVYVSPFFSRQKEGALQASSSVMFLTEKGFLYSAKPQDRELSIS